MTLVFITRNSAGAKLIARRILQEHNQKVLKSAALISSSRSFSASSFLKSVFNQQRKLKSRNYKKDLNVAIASGVLLVASCYSLSTHYLSDTGDSFKAFSTTNSNSNNANSKQQSIFLLSEDEITKRLRNLEESYFVNRGKGVIRYDISQLPSNNPIEDDRSESVVTVSTQEDENTDFYFWGIYDGHSGYYTSLKLRDELINSVVSELGSIYKSTEENPKLRSIPSQDAIDLAIKNGFLKLDEEIVQKSLERLFEDPNNKEKAINALAASSGSCGLLTFYDSSSKKLKVAVTGDSRALLGSLNENNEWTVKSLSVDQTGDNPEEVERIRSEHPNEPTAVRNGRVLGSLQPTRAFGDFRYKLKEIKGKTIDSLPEHLRFYFRSPPKNLLTPPYVTAEPFVSTTTINPSKNDFVVIGSDGLYELLSNEEIVGLVVKWLEKNKVNNTTSQTSTSWNLFSANEDKKLPKVLDVSDPKYKDIQRPPFRNKKNDEQHEYLLEDKNVSTHLIRNALSLGGSKEYVSTLVSIPSPKSRSYRDDLTVTVVFFGDQEKGDHTGKLEVNSDATRNGKLTQEPKL